MSATQDREQDRSEIRALVLRFSQQTDLQDSDDIFALGFVNSLFAMQLVTFIESRFGVTIEDEDLDIDNFRSVNALADLVERKRQSQAQPAN